MAQDRDQDNDIPHKLGADDEHPAVIRFSGKPTWLNWATIGVILALLTTFESGSFWVINKFDKADSTAVSLITVNARLDKIFEKLDVLPVIQEQLTQSRKELIDGKGEYSDLNTRLRIIELDEAANHADLQRKQNTVR